MFLPEPSGKQFSPAPSGNHVAIAYRFLDLGTQLVEWKGVQKHQHKIMISWELPNELMTEGDLAGQPFTAHKRFTWSMSEKASLRRDLEAWRGKPFVDEDFIGAKRFNVKNIVGRGCMLNIIHENRNGNVYANIAGIAALPKGLTIPAHKNPLVFFGLTKEDFDPHVLEGLSEKLQQVIKSSPEYIEIVTGTPPKSPDAEDDFDDDQIPF
jgi:hypothetical protein